MILKNAVRLTACLAAVMAAMPAHATKTVTSPYVTEGRAVVEWRGGYEEDENGDHTFRTRNQAAYGFTDFYEMKLSADTRQDEGDKNEFSDIDIENKFQITPRGKYFVDLGLRLDYARSLNGGADEIGTKILFGKKTGDFTHLLNLEAGREVGGDSDTDDWAYGLAYGVSHPLTEDLALGAEWYSDFADFEGGYSDHDHRVGPVLYGSLFEAVKYQAGVLAGVSESAQDYTVKATVNYSLQF